MASSVFYKFNSQKNESRVTFDGTGISVFDLKRDVILANNMGKANDFDLFNFDSSSNKGAFQRTRRKACVKSVIQSTRTTPRSFLGRLQSS